MNYRIKADTVFGPAWVNEVLGNDGITLVSDRAGASRWLTRKAAQKVVDTHAPTLRAVAKGMRVEAVTASAQSGDSGGNGGAAEAVLVGLAEAFERAAKDLRETVADPALAINPEGGPRSAQGHAAVLGLMMFVPIMDVKRASVEASERIKDLVRG